MALRGPTPLRLFARPGAGEYQNRINLNRIGDGIKTEIRKGLTEHASEFGSGLGLNAREQNGPGDALRHTYVMGEFTMSLGAYVMEVIGNWNESSQMGTLPGAMDTYNNSVGRRIGASSQNTQELEFGVWNAIIKGDLVYIDGDVSSGEIKHTDVRNIGGHDWSGLDDKYRSDRGERDEFGEPKPGTMIA